MKHPIRQIYLLICLFYVGLVSAQDTTIIQLHPMLGDEIDQLEKRELDLFKMIPDKEYRLGSFYMLSDSSLYLNIITRTGKVLNLPYEWQRFQELQRDISGGSIHVSKENDLKEGSYEENTYIIVELEGGGNFSGMLKKVEDEYLVLELEEGEMRIRKRQIKKLSFINNRFSRAGKFWFPNPNDTRYLFGPTAYPLGRNEGYYQNIYVLFNAAFVGITDHWDVGGGLEILSTLSGGPILFFSTKWGGKVADKFHLAGGALVGTVMVLDADDVFGNFFGVGTLGSRENNISIKLGYGFIDGEVADRPQITISGMTRVSQRLSLVSENWLLPIDGYYGAFSVGVRFMGEKTTFDFAFFRTTEWEAGIIAAPFLGFVYKF